MMGVEMLWGEILIRLLLAGSPADEDKVESGCAA